MVSAEKRTNTKEGEKGEKDDEEGEKVAWARGRVEAHDFDGSKEEKRERKERFEGASDGAEREGVGAGFNEFGMVFKGFGEAARDIEGGRGRFAEIEEEGENCEGD